MMQPLASGAGLHVGGSLGVAIADSATIRAQLNTLTTQAGSGRVSDSFAGLGSGAATSLALAPAIASNTAQQSAIDTATGRMSIAQTALTQISAIASTFYASTDTLNGLNSSNVTSVAANARAALSQVASLLDTTDGGVYVFAGQDSANPPVPDPDALANSGFATAIAGAVSGLASNGAAATATATLAIAVSNAAGTSPFSTALSQDPATVNALLPVIGTGLGAGPAGGATSVVGIMASANADVASGGSSTTGSYTRDILRSLATLAALTPDQIGAPGFAGLVSDTRASLGDAVTALNQDAGVMGDRQSALATAKQTLTTVNTALQAQVSSVQDVDMAATLTQLTRTQTQLQSSYQLIATVEGLSLTKYLSG